MNKSRAVDQTRHCRFLQPFAGNAMSPPPIWLMRQAGRYLPEYREVRARAGSFLNLCYNPAMAAEVTLQPIRRYGFDASILFSDILVVPDALGQSVDFIEGEGPRLDPVTDGAALALLDPVKAERKYAIICETVKRVRQDLPGDVGLIGFCGAPWTVATYMVAGQGTPDQAAARLWAYRDPEEFSRLIDLLTATSVEYLAGQVAAGADALQIFDSWAGNLPSAQFDRWVIQPTREIVRQLRKRGVDVPIIGFPRGGSPGGYGGGRRLVHLAARRPRLPMDEGRSRHRRDFVDGRHVVPAAPVYLPLRCAEGLAAIGDFQGDGAAPAAHHYQPGHGANLGVWALARMAGQLAFQRLVSRQAGTGDLAVGGARLCFGGSARVRGRPQ